MEEASWDLEFSEKKREIVGRRLSGGLGKSAVRTSMACGRELLEILRVRL